MKDHKFSLLRWAQQLPNNVCVLDNVSYCSKCGAKVSRPDPNGRGTIIHDTENCNGKVKPIKKQNNETEKI